MARNETVVNAPRDVVWEVLEDPYAYPRWVVGTDRTVEADTGWPAAGTKFKVHVALGYHDYTHSEEVDPRRRIVLNTAGGPWGAAKVTIMLQDAPGERTHVTLVEDPTGILKPLKWFPPAHLGIRLRNVESLRRFRRIAEARAVRARAKAAA